VVTGLILCAVPIWSLLEGCNQVSNVYTYRLIQGVAASLVAWLAIYSGAELWAASLSGLAGLLIAMIPIGRRYGRLLRTIVWSQPDGPA